MAFKKGESGNPTGRKKGAKNKVGHELREKIADFLFSRFDIIVEDFDKLPPQEKHKVYSSLLPYCLGKKQDLTIDQQMNQMSDEQLDEVLTALKKQA